MHGAYGEDGTLQNVLDALGVPYVGSGVYASATGMNKVATKRLAATQGIPVAASVMLPPGSDALTDAQQARLGLPVFVKPVRSGSGLGVTRVERWSELGAAIASARVHDTLALIEEAVGGWEVQVGILEHPDGRLEVGPPLEIQPSGSSWARGPARIPPAAVAQLERLALGSFRTLGCAGLLRADFMLRGGSAPVLLEVNTLPGLTPDSSFPLIWQAAGRSFPELVEVLLRTALGRRAGRRLVVPRQRARVISRRG
jgi:D-alanine-D-alanine ligase